MTLDGVEFLRRFLLHVLPAHRLRPDPLLRAARQLPSRQESGAMPGAARGRARRNAGLGADPTLGAEAGRWRTRPLPPVWRRPAPQRRHPRPGPTARPGRLGAGPEGHLV